MSKDFLLFIVIVLIITISLASYGLFVYRSEGTYSLDLSRPGYQDDYQKIIKKSDSEIEIDKEGLIDQQFIEQANKSLDYYQVRIDPEQAFTAASLSNQTLGLDVEN